LPESKAQRERQEAIHSPTKEYSLVANKSVAIVTKHFQLLEKPACFRVKPNCIHYQNKQTQKNKNKQTKKPLYFDLALGSF